MTSLSEDPIRALEFRTTLRWTVFLIVAGAIVIGITAGIDPYKSHWAFVLGIILIVAGIVRLALALFALYRPRRSR